MLNIKYTLESDIAKMAHLLLHSEIQEKAAYSGAGSEVEMEK